MNLKHLSEEVLYLAEDLKGFMTLIDNPYSNQISERLRIHLIKMDILIKEMLLKVDEEFK